jgi:hypothetical protein
LDVRGRSCDYGGGRRGDRDAERSGCGSERDGGEDGGISRSGESGRDEDVGDGIRKRERRIGGESEESIDERRIGETTRKINESIMRRKTKERDSIDDGRATRSKISRRRDREAMRKRERKDRKRRDRRKKRRNRIDHRKLIIMKRNIDDLKNTTKNNSHKESDLPNEGVGNSRDN